MAPALNKMPSDQPPGSGGGSRPLGLGSSQPPDLRGSSNSHKSGGSSKRSHKSHHSGRGRGGRDGRGGGRFGGRSFSGRGGRSNRDDLSSVASTPSIARVTELFSFDKITEALKTLPNDASEALYNEVVGGVVQEQLDDIQAAVNARLFETENEQELDELRFNGAALDSHSLLGTTIDARNVTNRRFKNSRSSSGPSPLASGMHVLTAPRGPSAIKGGQRAILKTERGTSTSELMKTRRIICVSLKHKLTCNRIPAMLAKNADVDISVEAQRWHVSVTELRDHLVKYDCDAPFLMPEFFDPAHPRLAPGVRFIDLLVSYNDVIEEQWLQWQEYVNGWASREDLMSQEMAAEVLMLSMDADLKSDVLDIYYLVPEHQRGGITLWGTIASVMVNKQQEAITSMHGWVQRFTILNYDGQDVTVASRRVKAMVRALDKDLPSNALSVILNGFAQASCPKFRTFCETRNSLLDCSILGRSSKQLSVDEHRARINSMCDELNGKYLALCLNSEWSGATHSAVSKTYVGAANVSPRADEDEDDDAFLVTVATYETFDAAQLYAAVKGRSLTYSQWKALQNCHFCKQLGHIKPQCPKFLALSKEQQDAYDKKHAMGRYRTQQRGSSTQQRSTKPASRSFRGRDARANMAADDVTESTHETPADGTVEHALLVQEATRLFNVHMDDDSALFDQESGKC